MPRFIQEARTNTPLAKLNVSSGGTAHMLWLKLETRNPTGSVKHRTALGLLASLDAQSPLAPGTRVVESTSGNLGLALARTLRDLDCQLVAVVDPKVPRSTRALLEAEGAELVPVTEPDVYGGYLLTRLAKVRELRLADPRLRWPDQYHNPANPGIHRDTLAEELVRQTGGRLDTVLVAVSTGGTLVGISEGLRAAAPAVRIYAVDAYGSVVTADAGTPHLLTGVGASRKSSFLHRRHFERAIRITDVRAFAFSRMLAEDTGLAVGGSAGAVLAAFAKLATGGNPGRHPVAVVADGGANYRSTFYDDGWLAARGVLERVLATEATARANGVGFDLELDPDFHPDFHPDKGR
ncbi:cysteine synthase family protein [Plantactinospora sp. CA-294935]|uniref:cysteine synthase family protein n=1 Tax=Plantactinospora sp. CA-294935 TaxID=3240012 RepID=UPI003D920D11